MSEWIKKMWYPHPVEYYPATKKEQNLVICDNMNWTWEHYTKWSKPGRKTNTIWCHLYVESKNKQTNKQTNNPSSQTQKTPQRLLGWGWGEKTGEGQKVQTSSYKISNVMVMIANNTLLQNWKLLREQILKVLITSKE